VAVGGDVASPSALVEESVVVAADQHEVPEGAGAAVFPGVDVVGVAEPGWGLTAGEGAAAVAQHQGAGDGGGGVAAGAADVEGDRAGFGEDPDEHGVAQQALGDLAGQRDVVGRQGDGRVGLAPTLVAALVVGVGVVKG
jgi:hypothetical protein